MQPVTNSSSFPFVNSDLFLFKLHAKNLPVSVMMVCQTAANVLTEVGKLSVFFCGV